MRAVTLDFRERRLCQRDVPEPQITSPTQVLLRVLEAGVCGTDRELANFRFGSPPPREQYLILGHEPFAEVAAVGSSVTRLKAGDLVVPMVRRACAPACASCARSRRDICITGNYTERGILGAHGYFADFAVDEEADLIAIPGNLADVAVLLEPLSVVEKAVFTAHRHHEASPSTAIVLGAGAIGILAALVLTLRGLKVTLVSQEPSGGERGNLVRRAGIAYTNAFAGKADVVIEATGSPAIALQAVQMLEPLGVLVVLGASVAEGRLSFLDMVLKNQVIVGSVNASPEAFARAVEDLGRIHAPALRSLIHRVPFGAFENSILGPPESHPKIVHAH